MAVKKIVSLYYVSLTAYLMLNATTLSFMMVIPAVLLMWLCYSVFWAGCRGLRLGKESTSIVLKAHAPYWLSGARKIFLIVLAVLFSILLVRFYTGQTVSSVITNLASENSLYWEYQKHFLENELGVLTLRKAPFILMMFCFKLLLIYSFVSLISLKKTIALGEKIFLLVVSLSYLFFSAARGTGFELFEVLFLALYSLTERTARTKLKTRHKVFGTRKMLLIGFLGILFLLMFSYYFNLRGTGSNYVTREVRYDPNSVLSQIAPPLARLSVELAGYFAFGFFYTSVIIIKTWLGSAESFFAGLLPFGFSMIGIKDFRQEVCRMIDCGAAWSPDVSILINRFGFFGLLLFCFLIGRFFRYINSRKSIDNRIVAGMTNFIIMLQMLSLPVGNFIIVSSSNKLIACFLVALWLRYMLKSARPMKVILGKGII